MLTPEEIANLKNATTSLALYESASERRYFIEPGEDAGIFRWALSKGTNFDCYVKYMDGFNSDKLNIVNAKIEIARQIIYAFIKPIQSQFFYWTLLLLIIHKFNFKKPIMRLILYHYVFRTIGDIVDGLCNGFVTHYFGLTEDGKCMDGFRFTEESPFKWFVARQINSFFWYIGEIIGDWYPLLRTKAVARDQHSIKFVYGTCIMYNLAKISVPISQLFLSPATLYDKNTGKYDKDRVDGYYNYYWCIQVAIIATSLIYDITVYIVLKKNLFDKNVSEFGFLKKFRTTSEFRIIVSAFIGVIGLPISLATAIGKVALYNNEYKNLNFSIEDFRIVVNNVQYMMIFIDQILLLRSKDTSTVETYGATSGNFSTNSYSNAMRSNTGSQFSKSLSNKSYESKNYYNLGSGNTLVNNNSQGSNLMNYTYSGIGNANNFGLLNNSSYYSRNNSSEHLIDNLNETKETKNNWNYMTR